MNIDSVVQDLFSQAQSKSSLDYLFTLLRVEGIKLRVQDPLLKLKADLAPITDGLSIGELHPLYRSMVIVEEPLALVANLLNCIQGQPYNSLPFHHLKQGQWPNERKPTPAEVVQELFNLATKAGIIDLARIINEAYPTEIVDECLSQSLPSSEQFQVAFQTCRSFLEVLLDTYFMERRKFRGQQKLYKLPRFEVLELLVDDESGLYGFRMHFSNGSSAFFERHNDGAMGQNIQLNPHIDFFVGCLDDLRTEWHVGALRLYEIGLPGRYNELGEWKPIVYPGKPDVLLKEVSQLSEDLDVQGTLFYIMATGHRVIEFVVRISVELPHQSFTFGKDLHFWMCPLLDDQLHSGRNVRLYDGWYDVEETDPEYLRQAIANIGLGVNRMAFAYDAAVDWCLKYRMNLSSKPLATPSEDDVHILDSLLRDFPQTDDAFLLDAAIDWYTRGKTSHNVFNAFLCYYIAIESVATAVTEGDADFGLGYLKESKTELKEKRVACIQEKLDRLYIDNPVKFVTESYFDCVDTLKRKTQSVAELVFGPSHEYIQALFSKGNDGYSLSEIRSKLAHGGVTLIDWKHENLVRNRLGEIAEISKQFLTRIIFLLKPTDALPSWSRCFKSSMHFSDPRSTLFTTDERVLPSADWKIRPEWIS